MNLPKWAWYIIWAAVILIVLVLLRINIQLGASGFSITQGLVR